MSLLGKDAQPDPAVETDDGSPQTMSLLGGVARPEGMPEGDELTTGPGGGGLLNQGTILIGIVTLIAAGSLYAMRLSQGDLSQDTATKQVEAKIEQALAKLTQPGAMAASDPLSQQNIEALFQDTDSIINMFSTDFTEHQVPAQLIKKNPFAIASTRRADEPPPPDKAEQERLRKLRALATELKGFELQSVMRGAVPVAVISGEFYRRGDRMGSFVVEQIEPLKVSVVAEGQRFELKIDDQPQPGRRR